MKYLLLMKRKKKNTGFSVEMPARHYLTKSSNPISPVMGQVTTMRLFKGRTENDKAPALSVSAFPSPIAPIQPQGNN